MMSKALIIGCGAILTTAPAMAHHNAAAHYLLDERTTVAGVVTEFRLVNPHSRIYFHVTNEEGRLEAWMAEGDSSINLKRSGWTADQFKPGDRIEIVGRPSRDGSNMVEWVTITLSDGAEFGGGNGRVEERLRILEERLAQYRQRRGRPSGGQ